MLAEAGAPDIFLSYNLSARISVARWNSAGNIRASRFQVQADHPGQSPNWEKRWRRRAVSRGSARSGRRAASNGIPVGPEAKRLYPTIAATPGLRAGGFHVYDGHQHQKSREERAAAVNAEWDKVAPSATTRARRAGGSANRLAADRFRFRFYAAKTDKAIELSPGTWCLQRRGYSEAFPDLVFKPEGRF